MTKFCTKELYIPAKHGACYTILQTAALITFQRFVIIYSKDECTHELTI